MLLDFINDIENERRREIERRRESNELLMQYIEEIKAGS